MPRMLRLVSQDEFAPEGMQPPLHEPTDAALLDAYWGRLSALPPTGVSMWACR
jgi:hypothetical protein